MKKEYTKPSVEIFEIEVAEEIATNVDANLGLSTWSLDDDDE